MIIKSKYISCISQMQSLNTALENNAYETIKDVNGVYEAFPDYNAF
jgi:hypothetical protein